MGRRRGGLHRITPGQLAKIWVTAKELNLDAEDLHEVCRYVTGKESLKLLSSVEAYQLIEELLSKGGRSGRKGGASGSGRENTQALRRKMFVLSRELGWGENPARLQGFCRRMTRKDRPEWMDEGECCIVIEALKKMVARSKEQGQGQGQEQERGQEEG